MAKACAAVGSVLALGGAALMAYTTTTPDWFHATYKDECAVGKIGLFESEWAPESCSGGRISGPDVVLDTAEFWPLFPLQFPNITGNPMQPITQEFVDCNTSVAAVYDYVNANIAALAPLLAGLDGAGLDISQPEVWGPFASGALQGAPTNYPPEAADALVQTVIGYTAACLAADIQLLPLGTQFVACGELLGPFLIGSNLAKAFNSDPPETFEVAVAACEDDNIDYDNLILGQTLIPVAAGLAGVGGILGLVSIAAAPAAVVGGLLSIGGGAAMFAMLMILRGTPAAASVGEECEGIDRACYTSELNGLLGLLSVVCAAVGAGFLIGSFVMAKRNSENSLVSL